MRVHRTHLLAQATITVSNKSVIQLLLGIFTRGKRLLAVDSLQLVLPICLRRHQAGCPHFKQGHMQPQALLILRAQYIQRRHHRTAIDMHQLQRNR
ncbi:hypothetical protein D3C72_2120510 [compost metagenome]